MSILREKIIRDFTDCAKIENFRLGANGELYKRNGYMTLNTFAAPIRGAVSDGDAIYIVSADGFYTLENNRITLIGTLADAVFSDEEEKVIMFVHSTKVFILGGGGYYRYDTVSGNFSMYSGYAPIIGSTVEGEDISEPYNILTATVRRRFNLANNQTVYNLPEKATAVNSLKVNGVLLSSSEYSCSEIDDSLVIYIDPTDFVGQEKIAEVEYVLDKSIFKPVKSYITDCKKSYIFSTDTASFIFLYDSPNMAPGHIIYSAHAAAPTDSYGDFDYFLDGREFVIGDGTKPIRAITQLGDRTVAITSDGIYEIRASILSSGDVRFYTSRLYSEIGASENSGIAVYENNLFFVNETGLFRLSYDSVSCVYKIFQMDIPDALISSKSLYKSIRLHIDRVNSELWCYTESGIGVYSIRYQKWYNFSGIKADFFFNVNAKTAFVDYNTLNIFDENVYEDADGGFEAFIESKNLSFDNIFTEKTIYAFGAAFERREGAALECVLINDKGNEFRTVIESDGSGVISPVVRHTHARLGKSAYIIYRISSPDYASPANLREIMFRYRTTGV